MFIFHSLVLVASVLVVVGSGHVIQDDGQDEDVSHMAATPTTIQPGITKNLAINCSLSKSESSPLTKVLSLTISRSAEEHHDEHHDEHHGKHDEEHTDLASVSPYSDGKPVQFAASGQAKVQGHVSVDGDLEESFLSLSWDYPSGGMAGVYRCVANGLDGLGRVVSLKSSVDVKVDEADPDLWLEHVLKVQRQMDGLGKETDRKVAGLYEVVDGLGKETDRKVAGLYEVVEELVVNQRKMMEKIEFLQEQAKGMNETVGQQAFNLQLLTHFSTFNGSMYVLSKQGAASTIQEAIKMCEDVGGHLAELNNQAEYQFVKEILERSLTARTVIISGTDQGHEGTWTHQRTGQGLKVTPWRSSTEPSSKAGEHCVRLERSWSWKMGDLRCSGWGTNWSFLCEVPQE